MKIDVTTSGDKVLIKIIGRVDNFTYPIVENDINILLKTGVKNVLIDMSEITFVCMKFIRLLHRTQLQLKLQNGNVAAINIPNKHREKVEDFFKSDKTVMETI